MSKLIIITGVSGTGKTTLAKMLNKKLEGSTLLSYDEFIEKIYDMIGFKNKEQKKNLSALNIKIYKKLIEECMKRKDEIIILEKPFKTEWRDFLGHLTKKYGYQPYTINIFSKDFQTIWNRLLKREISKEDRHPAHYLDSYYFDKRNEYTPFFEYEYDTLKEEYDNLISNSINLGCIININDIENLDIDKLIKKLLSNNKKVI